MKTYTAAITVEVIREFKIRAANREEAEDIAFKRWQRTEARLEKQNITSGDPDIYYATPHD